MSEMKTLWLRAEDKKNEKRTPLIPKDAAKIIQAGHKVIVEEFEERIFSLQDYKDVGCSVVKRRSWIEAPKDAFILGLKEIKHEDFPFKHKHIYFAHCYKGQDEAEKTLARFKNSEGKLFDLEFLVDQNGRRIAAFGKWAGFVGAAIAAHAYYYQYHNGQKSFPSLTSYNSKEDLVSTILKLTPNVPPLKAIIIGALGRCGKGAVELLNLLNLNATEWDFEETKKGGPFKEIIDHDIFINTVLMTQKVKPFLDDSILNENMKLKIVADVSCDPNSDLNPIPIYSEYSNWESPLLKHSKYDLSIISVDNLPSVLPKESSEDFSEQLTPHLLELLNSKELPFVWNSSLEKMNKFI